MNETLRINGTARITNDTRLLAPSTMQNHAPKVGLIVTIEEAFLQLAILSSVEEQRSAAIRGPIAA